MGVVQEDSWVPEHTERTLATWLDHPASACAVKGEEEGNKWCPLVPPTPERVLQFFSLLADVLGLVNVFPSCIA